MGPRVLSFRQVGDMRLPNGENAVIDPRKIRDYILNLRHQRGQHKARVFAAALAITQAKSKVLADALRQAALSESAVDQGSDVFGRRFAIDFRLEHHGRVAAVRSHWIILANETAPRFVTAFIRD
jgi:hypothetical protein